MKILGIDYGQRRIGLAMSEGRLAAPLTVLTIKSQQQALQCIREIAEREKIDKIVIGISERRMAERTAAFARSLKRLTHLSVVFSDETLTTQEAEEKMIEAGMSKKKRRVFHDAIAAALLLQRYLDAKVPLDRG